ncbi:hypothetical protein EVAR_45807_1 [Eumeta japonica]|uniref:Uncharacterized protein n=1 Tax=Eumeta variegata TaxID=151549 RepID=A0A4C1X259_EUMVA|nr:hypothetical protein EVAR_45807_1 [Eumeta japonica]
MRYPIPFFAGLQAKSDNALVTPLPLRESMGGGDHALYDVSHARNSNSGWLQAFFHQNRLTENQLILKDKLHVYEFAGAGVCSYDGSSDIEEWSEDWQMVFSYTKRDSVVWDSLSKPHFVPTLHRMFKSR